MVIKKIKNMLIILTILTLTMLVMVRNVNASDVWSEGTTYKVTPSDNMVTVKDYTIKAVDFPAPIRGIRTINGSIVPDRPVVPFVTLELYQDIINNTNPISKFSLGIGDEFITSDDEIRITLDDIPGSMSQNWIYEYYDPWASIRIQKRGIPSLDIGITIADIHDNGVDENAIDPGDRLEMNITAKNTGEDVIKNIDFYVEDPSMTIMPSKLKYTIDSLDKDEEKVVTDTSNIILDIPKIIDEREYEIYVNATGHDIKNVEYSFNTSKKIKSRNALQLLTFNKTATRDSIYLKEYEIVVLNIINYGNIYIENVQIYDSLLNQTTYIKNKSITEFSLNDSSIGPGESWSFDYTLKPLEPGIYVLPGFKSTFSMLGQNFETTSNDAGFRVFGPRVILDKTAKRNEEENDLIDVDVTAKNIGNGFAKVVIEDKLPYGGKLISGKLNLTTPLDPGTEKIMNYTIRVPWDMANEIANEMANKTGKTINITSWPPAKARYYLDDYVFTAFSNETHVPFEKLVWTIESKEISKKEEKMKEIKKEEKEKEEIVPMTTLPEINEAQKRVVATIPAKTPVKTPEKSTPGFRLYEIVVLVTVLILLDRNRIKKNKNKERNKE